MSDNESSGELVTVIVPVYNAKQYLNRCLSSLVDQTYGALQIMLVDDGSTDGGAAVCEAYARRDGRVEIARTAHRGVSAARNAGLDRARGGWIAFVDADDYVSPYYIEDMLTAARGGCDMAVCGHTQIGGAEEAAFTRVPSTRIITGREACVSRFGKLVYVYNQCWGKLYKTELWDGLRYPEGMAVGEDVFLSHALLYRSDKIAVTDAVLYAYVQTDNSAIRAGFSPKRLDALDAWREAVRFYGAAGEPDLENIARRVYCSRVFDALCICKRRIPSEKEIIRRLKKRAVLAYRDAKPIGGYIDCSPYKAHAYRLKFFLGRWFTPLYALLFVGRSTDL